MKEQSMTKTLLLGTILAAGVVSLMSAQAAPRLPFAVQTLGTTNSDVLIIRGTTELPRGASADYAAREGNEGPRGEGAGHAAREGNEGPRGEGAGHA